jgi:hypothetical protein
MNCILDDNLGLPDRLEAKFISPDLPEKKRYTIP